MLIHTQIYTYTFDFNGLLACLELSIQVPSSVEECLDKEWIKFSCEKDLGRKNKLLQSCWYCLISRHSSKKQSLNFRLRDWFWLNKSQQRNLQALKLCLDPHLLVNSLLVILCNYLFHTVAKKNLQFVTLWAVYYFFFFFLLKATSIGLGFYCYPL